MFFRFLICKEEIPARDVRSTTQDFRSEMVRSDASVSIAVSDKCCSVRFDSVQTDDDEDRSFSLSAVTAGLSLVTGALRLKVKRDFD